MHACMQQYVDDVSIEWLYKPHTITASLVFIIALVYCAFVVNDDTLGQLHNTRIGVTVACGFFLLLGLLVFPSGPFIRPHPLVWRLAYGELESCILCQSFAASKFSCISLDIYRYWCRLSTGTGGCTLPHERSVSNRV